MEKQVIFENTHEVLVSQETWEIVQKNRQNRRRPTQMESFLKLVQTYTVPDKLFPELLRAFAKKIVVHVPDKSSGHHAQQIVICCNFIGDITLSPAIDKKEPA